MNSIRWRAALLTWVIGAALGVSTLGAQTPGGFGAADGRPADADRAIVSVAVGASSHPVAISDRRSAAADAQSDQTDQSYHFYRPVLRIGQDYTLRAGDTAREIQTFFGNVTLAGRVERQAVVVFGSVHARSTAVVEDSLVVIGGSATIDQGAAINGDLVVVGGTVTAPADFSPGGQHVVIGSPGLGHALDGMMPWLTHGLLWGRLIVPEVGWIWWVGIIAFLVYLVVNAIFERPVRTCADAIVQKPFSTFLLGLLVLVLTVPALAILAATVIGVAVIPFVLCGMFLGGLVGKAGVARALGRGLVAESSPGSKVQSLRSFVIGSVLITLAYMVPLLGVTVWALTSVLAVGSAAMMLRASLRREHPPRERAVAAPSARVAGPAAAAVVGPDAAASSPDASSPSPDAGVQPPIPPVDVPPPPLPPRPAIAGDLGLYTRATFLDRVAAFALDCVLVGIAVAVLDLSRHGGSYGLVLFLYHLAFWAWKGTTLGGIVVGLRVIRTQGTDLRFADALVRALGGILSLVALGIGCFWMLQDPERQMWHDKIAGTFVVKMPRNVVLG